MEPEHDTEADFYFDLLPLVPQGKLVCVSEERWARLEREREADRAAIRLVLEGFDKGIFTRDTSHDHESGWAVRLLPYLNALGHLARATGQEGAR